MTASALRQLLCPVALHPDGLPLRLPVIEGADGTLTLPHCAQEPDVTRSQAAANVLYHQTGLETGAAVFIGDDQGRIAQNTLWHFYLCRIAPPVRTRWQHLTPCKTLNRLGWIELSADAKMGTTDTALRDTIRGLL